MGIISILCDKIPDWCNMTIEKRFDTATLFAASARLLTLVYYTPLKVDVVCPTAADTLSVQKAALGHSFVAI